MRRMDSIQATELIGKLKMLCIVAIMGGACFVALMVLVLNYLYPDGESGIGVIDIFLKKRPIQTIMPDDKWASEYPFDEGVIEQYDRKIENMKIVLNSYCSDALPGREHVSQWSNYLIKGLYHYNLDEIIDMNVSADYVSGYVENVVTFRNQLAYEGYPMLYVQTPLLASIQYSHNEKVDNYDELKTAERSCAFVQMLQERNVDVLTVADKLESVQYDNTNHWFPRNALDATKIIINKLCNEYGCDFDFDIFKKDAFYNLLDDNSDYGAMINEECGYEYSLPVPKSNMEYTVVYAEEEKRTGTFEMCLLNGRDQWIMHGGAYHNIYYLDNSLVYEITNHSVENETSILVVGDSFDWPVCAYMATGVEKVIFVHNESFSGSIMSYIRQHTPDIVIVMYNDTEFWERYAEQAFDLR